MNDKGNKEVTVEGMVVHTCDPSLLRLRWEDSKVKAHMNYVTTPYFLPLPPNTNKGKKERMRRKRKEREKGEVAGSGGEGELDSL